MTPSTTMNEQSKSTNFKYVNATGKPREFYDREHLRNRAKTTSGVTLNGEPNKCWDSELLQFQSSLLPHSFFK